MITRILEKEIEDRMLPNKVIVLLGARRVGKTVLIKEICEKYDGKYLYLNGEDSDVQSLLEKKSIANYKSLIGDNDLLIIDEAQVVSDIGAKIKLIADEIEGIKIIISGSSSFDLLNRVGEPLVGRSSHFILYPFSQNEYYSKESSALQTLQNLDNKLIYGSYPELINIDQNHIKEEYLTEIVNSYLLKDILTLDGIRNSNKIRDLLKLLAYQNGSEVSYSELGNKLSLSKNTVEKYMDLLSKVFIIFKLGGFSKNLRKEVVKYSKWYFTDNGIRNAIIGNFDPISLRKDLGLLWENYLISERIKRNNNMLLRRQYYFWRTYDGQEIDFIEVDNQQINAYEIKWGNKKTKAPAAFTSNYKNATFNILNRDNYLDFIT